MLNLSSEGLEWSLKQALNYGDTDIFPEIFEFKAINFDKDGIFNGLKNEDVLNRNVRPHRRCLTPKHQYGFRISTQLDPIDFLVFTTLVYEIGEDIENTRVPKNNDVVHSYRFSPNNDGQMYDKNYGYETFSKTINELLNEDKYNWIVMADIADFFPRLYHHRVYNALIRCTNKNNHAVALDKLLSGWNENISYGIPVGSASSRLLAEIALDDVDRALLSERTVYTRYSDDFRIFCSTKREAYEKLSFLANVLFENHGLTLQQNKTRIISTEEFGELYFSTTQEEINKLSKILEEIFDEMGLDFYDEIDWDDLTEEQQKEISELNLREILSEQVEKKEINIQLTRFVVRRLTQLSSEEALDIILNNIENLYPIIPDVIKYILSLKNLHEKEKLKVGKHLINLLDNSSIVSHLEFHRMWLLKIFTEDMLFNNEDQFVKLISDYNDNFTKRKLILALGNFDQDEWFRRHKRSFFEFPTWVRRAILCGGSCLPPDERKHWYHSLNRRLDPLELAIIKWGKQNT